MGCWNQTCMLSRLPIHAGDKVVAFLIHETPFGHSGGICYSTDLYQPIFIPIYGQYNDYGAIEECPEQSADNIVTIFKNLFEKGIAVIKEDTYYSNEIPTTLEAFIEYVERGRVTIKNTLMPNDIKFMKLTFVMMHEDIFNDVITEIHNRIPYNQTECYGKLLRLKYNSLKEKYIKFKQMQPPTELASKPELLEEYYELLFSMKMDEKLFNYHDSHINNEFDFIKNIDIYLDSYLKFSMFSTAMQFGRLTWFPQSGQGSQDSEYRIHEVIANSASNIKSAYFSECDCEVEDCDKDDCEGCEVNILDMSEAGRETIHWWDRD